MARNSRPPVRLTHFRVFVTPTPHLDSTIAVATHVPVSSHVRPSDWHPPPLAKLHLPRPWLPNLGEFAEPLPNL